MAFSIDYRRDLISKDGVIPTIQDEVTVGWAAQVAANTLSIASEWNPGLIWFTQGTIFVPENSNGSFYLTKGGGEDGEHIFTDIPAISIGKLEDDILYLATPEGTAMKGSYFTSKYFPSTALFTIDGTHTKAGTFIVTAIGW